MHELAFIALGSNLGDSPALIQRARERLQALSNHTVKTSSLYRSKPVGCPSGSPDFVNAMVALVPRTGETPLTLLMKLQFMETQFGRLRDSVQNSPRPLDLDLIAFGSVVHKSAELTLPHPRAHLRRFVLQPLVEIAPDLVLPGHRQSVSELLAALGTDQELKRLP